LRAVFVTVFIDLMGFSIIFPLFPAMLRHYLAREGEAGLLGQLLALLRGLADGAAAGSDFLVTVLFGGLLGSLYAALQLVSAPALGRLSDRLGRRPVLLFTVAGNLVGYLLWVVSGSFLLLVLSRVVTGVMGGNLAVASAAIADVTPPEERARGMAVIGVAFGLGFILGPAIGGLSAMVDPTARYPGLVALGVNPFSVPALCAAALALANLIQMATALPETLPAASADRPRPGALALLRSGAGALRKLALVNLTATLALSGLEFSLTFLALERLGYGPTENIRLFLFLGVIMVITQGVLVRRLAPRIGERRLAAGGLTLELAAFLALALAAASPPFYLGLGLLGLGAGLLNPSLAALVSLHSDPAEQGQNQGAFRAAGALARAVGPISAAAVYFGVGSRDTYLLGGMMLALPVVLALRLPRAR
jgi:MFS family permease